MASILDILQGNFPAAQRYKEGYAQMPSYLQDPYLGLSTSNIGNVTKGLLSKTQFEKAQEIASKNAETLLGLPKGNTAMDRAKAMGFDVDNPMYHGTRQQFNEFELSQPRGAIGNPPGVYFTKDKSVAEEYALNGDYLDERSRIIKALLKDAQERTSAYSGKEYLVTNPANIRDINAAFDPARMNESNILAGVMAIPVSGLLQEPKEKKKKK